jgi:acyl-CoA synthetase (AMP-forming)/AMP-acid ligase II/acyl carrier protein
LIVLSALQRRASGLSVPIPQCMLSRKTRISSLLNVGDAGMSDIGADSSSDQMQGEFVRPDRTYKEHAPAASDRTAQLNEPRTIGEAIRVQASVRPEQPAIVGSSFQPLSYRKLQDHIGEVRACLRQAGFDSNARIVVAIADSAPAALAIIAVGASAVAVPLDPKLTTAEVERCLTTLRPNAVLVLRDANVVGRTVAEQLGVPIIEAIFGQKGEFSLQLTVSKAGPSLPLDDPDPETPVFILHTSGTTADPNLVPFNHRNLLAVTNRLRTWFDLTPADRCLNVSPVYYSHALTTTILPPLITGGSVAFPANASRVDLSEWFGGLKPTWYSAGPTLHLSVLEHARQRADARTMHSLRFISSAGAQIAREVHEGIQSTLGVPVLEHYGSSETAQIATNLPPPGPSKPGTCGIPWPDIIIIVGEDGRRLPVGERGEILVTGPSVMSGYLNAPDLNRSVFIDGWYRTGDIGSLDADGFLTLHGRRKELINRGSEKIAPPEIDQALMSHPDVEQAAAFAVPHPRLGEDVAAAVVLRSGAKVTPIELREFLSQRLATFKVPRRISIVDQLPKGITGKVQRKRLSETVLEQSVKSDASLHEELLQLWKKFLKTESVSIDDDFFEKGGDSILAMELHSELQRVFGRTLPESILFDASTVRDLAKLAKSLPPMEARP